MTAADTATGPGTGTARRRRGAELEAALLQAAWDELIEVGYADFTLDGVAARAGTSRPVLARRWAGPAELVLAAVSHHATLAPIEVPDTGTLRGDVLALLRHLTARTNEVAGILSFLIGDHFRETRQPLAAVREQSLAGQPGAMRRILDHAVARGEISPAILGTRIASLPVDLVRHEVIFTQAPVPDAALIEIVDTIFLPLARAHGVPPALADRQPRARACRYPLAAAVMRAAAPGTPFQCVCR
jgi:AcrR family transcriptional regulator